MKLWKRAGPVALSLALCAGLVLPALAHTVTIDGEGSQEVGTVQDGVNAIEASQSKTGTITMTSDGPDSSVTISGGNVTLDLNGWAITNNDTNGAAITVSGGGKLTLQDSGTGGKVEATGMFGAGVEVNGGATANILGGEVKATGEDGNGVYVSDGEATISGDATVTGKTGVQVEEDSTFTMDGGTVGSTVENGAAIAGTGTITLKGGTIYGKVPESVSTGNVTVEAAPYVPPAPTPDPDPTPLPDPVPAPDPDQDPDPAPDPLARPAAAETLLEELFRRVGGSGDLWTWAVENGLIDEDGDGDEIVTVGLLRAILGRYAEVFGGNAVAVEELTTLTGEDTDVVDNCRAVLNEFFGE